MLKYSMSCYIGICKPVSAKAVAGPEKDTEYLAQIVANFQGNMESSCGCNWAVYNSNALLH